MAKLHIGLSGYDYKEWQGEGLFYAPTVKKANYLSAYAEQLNSLEANGTFQRMPSEASVAKWITSTPPTFTISPKMVQNVTHFKRLNPEAIDIAKEFIDVLKPLDKAGKLGPILLQLPPNFKRDDEKLSKFLDSFTGVRWAVEFRNSSWNTPEVADLLRSRGAAFASVETDEEEAQTFDTAPYFFARLRRLEYTDEQLMVWGQVLKKHLANGKDCFVYCRHKDTVEPWKWAFRLRDVVG
ncbi:MAG: DUF72 domain-containing protein [Armatimonadetes bacterium]|nr:DUF72 domain-containing protein [Armatimonadota bacterium]